MERTAVPLARTAWLGPRFEVLRQALLERLRYIARGFWKRDGELLALASLDEAAGFFGPSLELRAFRFDAKTQSWSDAGSSSTTRLTTFRR